MRRSIIAAILTLVVAGCAAEKQVVVPRSNLEGMACVRECQRARTACGYQCMGLVRLELAVCSDDCDAAETTCWSTCPGAYTR